MVRHEASTNGYGRRGHIGVRICKAGAVGLVRRILKHRAVLVKPSRQARGL